MTTCECGAVGADDECQYPCNAERKDQMTTQTTSHKATAKQVRYALYLLGQAGYQTTYMNAQYSELGATMRQRSGQVSYWLENMDSWKISHLIDQLKGK